MRYTLKDYQDSAVRDVLRNLLQAKDSYHRFGSLSQFSLSATTGAGKTVMAAAIIEALFFGSDEYEFEADPGAVVLWFSDDPALNVQSRDRIQAAASELDTRLKIVESNFAEPTLRPGHVYFLNRDKLAKGSRLVRGEPELDPSSPPMFEPRLDDAQTSIYDTMTSTITTEGVTLYFVLDEAHVGMRNDKDRETIVRRLINGQNSMPPMPVVFGISATVERFDKAMAETKGRMALPAVEVDPDLVQASGLLKDDIRLSIPTESGQFDTVLLQRAVDKVRTSSQLWRDYADEQGDHQDPVLPLLVVQVADKPDQATLVRIWDTIYKGWPDLKWDAVANVFGDHDGKSHPDLHVGQYVIPYIEPQRVQDATHVRVLLAKSAISQGWDCPRAEVLVSFRPANDRTHITQLLGRMTRTPLARRIDGNELLNSVDCLLPYFDRKTATEVADILMQGATKKDIDVDQDTGGGKGRRVLFDPVDLARNPAVPDTVWQRLESMPTVTIPRVGAKPIRRLTALATALSKDGLIEGAVAQAHARLHVVLDGQTVQHKTAIAAADDDVRTMEGEEIRRNAVTGVSYEPFSISADPRAIEDYYRAATRAFSPTLAGSYVDHLASDSDDTALLDANIAVAALARVPEVVRAVEREADDLARTWLTKTRAARKNLTDERQAEYDRLESMAAQPERTSLVAPSTGQADTRIRDPRGNESDLPTWTGHLLAAADGSYPRPLNKWETSVLTAEMKGSGFLGWYRNPSRSSKDSLAVAWRRSTGEWRAMRPDFIFFGTAHDGSVAVDLVDPHGHHLSDALPKLRGLADFAEQYGDEFRRIESVAETGGVLRVLDFKKAAVREAIRHAQDVEQVYRSAVGTDY